MPLQAVDVSELYITNKVSAALPIDDLLSWLISEHPDASLKQILSMLNKVYQGGFTISPAGTTQRTYQVGERGLDAYPQRVEG